ncbi:MAG TPA: HAMP domain-containing sensor histidine kinase [Thermoanaerobaculia bacterium]
MIDPILDQAPCGFVSVADDGTVLEVNSTLATLTGYTRVELLGWHFQKVLPPGARIFYQTHVFPMLKMHGAVDELYVTLRTRDGKDIPMLMNGIRGERDGAFVNDCVFMRMIQREEFEEQLLQARRLAEQANAAKAKFMSMMSHDLRTPLTTITGHARLLAAGVYGPLTEEQLDGVERISGAGREVLRMINDILSFATLEKGSVEMNARPVPLPDAVERAVSLIRLRLEETRLELTSTGCGDVMVWADPDRLQQVLLNLLTNAMKFTRPGGRIAVECEHAGERVLIRVRDTGVGIATDQLQRVFEPFVQIETELSEGEQQGVGLGLAISRDLARAMGGELTLESAPGAGSTFTIELPAAVAQPR